MSNRPNVANIGRVDLKTSPAAKNVKTETVSISGNQTDSTQRDRGSRFSSVRVINSVVERSQTNDAEVEKNAKIEPTAHDESDSSAAEIKSESNEKKFSGRCRLFVGNLPNDLSENDFQKFFEPFGELSEVFLNAARGFGFLRLDTRHHAENARATVDGQMYRGRPLRVRFAAHGAALRVKYLSPHISNEMLAEAFSIFGEIERAIVAVDDRGKPTGEGIVEFSRKPNAMTALKRISEGVFLMTSSPRPISVELLEQKDENDGLPEIFFQKTTEVLKQREQPPRFAQPGSFEYEFGLKWKTLYQMLHEQQELLKKNFDDEVSKMEMDMEAALMEQHTALLRQDLMRRQEELNRLEEKTKMEIQRRMEMRQRQEDERRRQQSMEMMETRRHEDMLWRQHRKMADEDPFGGSTNRQSRPDLGALSQAPERSSLLPRPDRSMMQAAMQPPPVPPSAVAMERHQAHAGGPGPAGQGGLHAAAGPSSNGDKAMHVAKFMPTPLMQQQPPQQPQQQRPRFEHPQPGQPLLGRGGGPGGENPRMPGAPNSRDEYYDPKRMRRF